MTWPPASGQAFIDIGTACFVPDWHAGSTSSPTPGIGGYLTQGAGSPALDVNTTYIAAHAFFSAPHAQNAEWDRLVE